MLKNGVIAIGLLLASASAAIAQPRVEVSGMVNWVLADGVTTESSVIAGDGNSYTKADPKDSISYGFSASFLVGEVSEVGFIYGSQPTTLLLGGPSVETEIGDLTTSTYHAFFGRTVGSPEAVLRPYFLVGVGVTTFSSVDTTFGGQARTLDSQSKFSTTIGGGVKVFTSPRFGARAGLRWTPARIPADSAGWWCDTATGCYVVGGVKYATQLEFGGGVFVRF